MDEGNVGKDLAIKEKIENIVSKIRSGENLEQEELMIAVKGTGIPLTIEKDEKEASHKMHILGAHILTLEDEELSFTQGWEDELRAKTEGIIDAEDLINELKEMELSLERQKEEQQRDENEGEERGESNEKGEAEKPKIEKTEREEPEKKDGNNKKTQEELNPKSKDVQEMDLGREFTDTDDLRKYVRDVFKEDCDRLYRVKTGSHDFKYMAERDGEYKELDLSTRFEGRNTTQEVYILDEEGNFKREEVDSLLLARDGRRGIATKIPDSGSTDVTKSFAVREINGKYVATQLIEKSGQNRDPKLPGADRFDRARGTEELRQDLENMEEMENKNLDFAEDGISVQEITLYEHFEKLGFKEDEIDKLIKYMQDGKKTVEQAEELGKRAKEIEKEKPNEMPGSNWRAAQLEIEGDKYERAEGGNTPDQNPRKRNN